ncbi:phage antirepressor KilAC domain-containing protein [Adlercreutzia sp. R25]|uniref:phage antirepressor n=1 Tax=Adlercreutzia shanghongiae TaxID=3111773 RepID=UPI002DBFB429|nr:phage antirepressor KilAC domain-containing protein [Adlercreutzia sp. R25]MEC4272921.1 phage antirepressor KilAC domain-containing protein [Adlercreutzia sp. R25]
MSGIKIFDNPEFGAVRTSEQDGEILFCAKDVAVALGYKDPTNAIKLHCKGVVKRHPLQTPGGTQEVRFIGEPDVFRLIVSSKLPSAQRFEAWLYEEVLPAIRRGGAYVASMPDETPEQLIARALAAAQEALARKSAQIDEMRPKALFADAVSASSTSILIGDLAKILKQNGYDTGQVRLFEQLRGEGFLMKQGASRNMPTQRAAEAGLFEVKESTFQNPDGSVRVIKTTKVTGKGQVFFLNRYLGKGNWDEGVLDRD